jgi:hypothetical protein
MSHAVIPSESRGIPLHLHGFRYGILRLRFASLRMTLGL